MLFRSTNSNSAPVTFNEAVLTGIAPDGGLWMPEVLPALDSAFLKRLPDFSLQQIAFEILSKFTEDAVPNDKMRAIIDHAFLMKAPLVQLSDGLFVLELFHGPTLAFKDFGAQFMAGLISHLSGTFDRPALVLAATSGDTGSAVVHAFHGRKDVRVVILYPSQMVSEIQEKQMTTLGGNICALEVSGTFDDCQRLVKQAFQDPDLKSRYHVISANSINIARLLPQCVYYLYACAQSPDKGPVVFSVPCGNFGNLTAGLFASRMGLQVTKFIAATNVNDVFPRYLKSGTFQPRVSLHSISNAMDVGNPSNFARILSLYDSDRSRMIRDISGYSFTDDQTRSAMKELFSTYGYTCDPHTAVAYLGLKEFAPEKRTRGIFLATAHPAKFGIGTDLPDRLKECLTKQKQSVKISTDYRELKDFL